ncbi:MAG: response regulator [Planctomycetes bacterium]|nr:response regulator [Planctomycetota bacterium]
MSQRYRILLIEDDSVDVEGVRRSLALSRHAIYDVESETTLERGLSSLGSHAFDAVLVDLSLPDATGLGAVESVVRLSPATPVVVFTGAADEEFAFAAIRAGAQDYVTKRGPDTSIERALRYAIDRKRFEVEQRRVDERLLEVQKLESLGLLAGGIAHDFNNLLTGVLGNASLSLMKVPKGSDIEGFLQQIERSAVRASDLCKQLLAYAGKGGFLVQALDMSEIVREMIDILELSVSPQAILRHELAEDLPAIEASPTQLRQVAMNLIINASDALEDRDGVISVRTGLMQCDEGFFTRTELTERLAVGEYAFLEVSDTGVGIPHEVREQIFEPFYSTKSHGRGLGLAAVLGIVRAHRAAIRVYSEPGKGTTFKVLFPTLGMSAPTTRPSTPERRVEYQGIALVVDDESAVVDVARNVLEQMGFEVLTAQNGVEALAEARRCGGRIEVVLLDMTMPRMGGEETFRSMHRAYPAVPIILSSGYNERDAIATLAGKGIAGFLQKPYAAKVLMDAVREAIARATQ